MRAKLLLGFALLLGISLASGTNPKTLTADPLTGLPLIPSTDSRLHLGNDPTVLPESQICKSKMETDFYSVFDTKFKDTVAWYESRLTGFKKTTGFAQNRMQTAFYKSDGTIMVGITAEPGAEGSDVGTHGIVFGKFTPGLPAKTIIDLNKQAITCSQ